MEFKPLYPVNPHKLNQVWGVYRPEVYSQFGFTRHNGQDEALSPTKEVRAPFDGVIYSAFYQPHGGGLVIGLLSANEYVFPAWDETTPDNVVIPFGASTCRVLVDFLHLQLFKVKAGDKVKTGDLLAIQDNTGFSTGPHTHTQWRREMYSPKGLDDIDKNDAHNSFNPEKFFNGEYASTVAQINWAAAIIKKIWEYLKRPAVTINVYKN